MFGTPGLARGLTSVPVTLKPFNPLRPAVVSMIVPMRDEYLTLEGGFFVVVDIGHGKSSEMQLCPSSQSQRNLLLLQDLSRKGGKLLQTCDIHSLVVKVGDGFWLRGMDLWHLEGHDLILGHGAIGNNVNGNGEPI